MPSYDSSRRGTTTRRVKLPISAEILATREPGQEIVVTRHGVPVAKVVGVGTRSGEKRQDIIKRISDRAKRLNLGFSNEELVKLGEPGRP